IFDTAGNEVSTAFITPPGNGASNWNTKRKWIFTYYPDHKVKTVIVEELGSSMLNNTIPVYRDSFAYDNGVDFYTRKWTWQYAGSNEFSLSDYMEHTINPLNLPDTVKKYKWLQNSWEHMEDVVFSYNMEMNPIEWRSFKYNNGIAAPFKIHHFYYKFFDTTTNIQVPGPAPDIIVFPNPVVDVLYLTWKNGSQKTLTIQLVDGLGRVVYNSAVGWTGLTYEIPVRHLPAGVYTLHVHDSKGLVIFRKAELR
ncbi:MAG: T9SS type A sorting domain-containing protein, partial [Sphingobacteriales bacterium]